MCGGKNNLVRQGNPGGEAGGTAGQGRRRGAVWGPRDSEILTRQCVVRHVRTCVGPLLFYRGIPRIMMHLCICMVTVTGVLAMMAPLACMTCLRPSWGPPQ